MGIIINKFMSIFKGKVVMNAEVQVNTVKNKDMAMAHN
jgi:hypothetical protein